MCRLPRSWNRELPVPVVDTETVTVSVPRTNRAAEDPSAAGASSDQNPWDTKESRKEPSTSARGLSMMPSAATWSVLPEVDTEVEPMVEPAGKVRIPAGQPSTISPAAVPGSGKAPVISGAGAVGAGSPVGVAVTGGRTSSGWPADGDEPPSSPFSVPPLAEASDGELPEPGTSAPCDVVPAEAVDPGTVEPGLGDDEDVVCAEGAGFTASWSKSIATAAISTARHMPAMTSRRAIMA